MQLDEVPPLPVDAKPTDEFRGQKVYDIGPYRWRYNSFGKLLTFIEYSREKHPLGGAVFKRLYSVE